MFIKLNSNAIKKKKDEDSSIAKILDDMNPCQHLLKPDKNSSNLHIFTLHKKESIKAKKLL